MVLVTVSLPKPIVKRTRRIASNTGRTVSGMVRISLQRYLEEIRNEQN